MRYWIVKDVTQAAKKLHIGRNALIYRIKNITLSSKAMLTFLRVEYE